MSAEGVPSMHRVRIWREDRWPYQWLGTCSCRRGTRCNSQQDAADFLVSQGCLAADGTPGRDET